MKDSSDISFSQEAGLEPLPQQLKLGEISGDFRNELWFIVHESLRKDVREGYERLYITLEWQELTKKIFAIFLKEDISGYKNSFVFWEKILKHYCISVEYNKLFDLLIFCARKSDKFAKLFEGEVAPLFEAHCLAYRVFGTRIVPVSTKEEADSLKENLKTIDSSIYDGAKRHFANATDSLNRNDYNSCVRESVHAIESMVRIHLNDSEVTLGKALSVLESQVKLHPALKKAFASLYGWSSDEKGIRHSLIGDEDSIDLDLAIFCLGSCASFASYLAKKFQVG